MKKALATICLLAIFITSCKQNKQSLASPGGPGATPAGAPGGGPGRPGGNIIRDYSVFTLTPRSVTIHQDFPAVVEGQRVIEIRPMINGYLKDIHVNEGDKVKKGQLLFRINNPQYEQEVVTAKARVNSAEADVNSATLEIEKVRPLVEKEIVSDYRLKSAELTLQAKKAALEQAKASLANAEANLSYTIIKSPQDGIIGTIPYKTGALVSSNSAEALTTLSDISEVFAYFSWNEKQVLEILSDSKGVSIEERVKSLPPATLILANKTEYPLKGKVEMASGLISTATGSGTFKAVFRNPDGLLRSGSSAKVRIPRIYDSVLVVPQSATYELQDKRFIYTVSNDNKVSAITFASVPTDDGRFFVVTDGLKPGDKIVTEGIISLKDGAVINPKEVDALSYYRNLNQ